jgi:hypothetical protein
MGFLSVLLTVKKRQIREDRLQIGLQSAESMHAIDTRKIIGAITIYPWGEP